MFKSYIGRWARESLCITHFARKSTVSLAGSKKVPLYMPCIGTYRYQGLHRSVPRSYRLQRYDTQAVGTRNSSRSTLTSELEQQHSLEHLLLVICYFSSLLQKNNYSSPFLLNLQFAVFYITHKWISVISRYQISTHLIFYIRRVYNTFTRARYFNHKPA